MVAPEKYGQEQGVYGQAPTYNQQQPYAQPMPMEASHQPTGHLEKEQNEWQTGICSCGPCSSCLLAWCLPCILLGQTSERIRDPSMQTADMLNSDCLIHGAISCFTGCGWIYAMIKRGEIRERYGIKGNGTGILADRDETGEQQEEHRATISLIAGFGVWRNLQDAKCRMSSSKIEAVDQWDERKKKKMASIDNVVRPVGSQAKFHTARHSLGILRAVIVTCRYKVSAAYLQRRTLSLRDVIESALATVVLRQGMLRVGVTGEDTKEPAFVHLNTIDMRRVVEWKDITAPDNTQSAKVEGEKQHYEDRLLRSLERYHEVLWEDLANRPGWKIVSVMCYYPLTYPSASTTPSQTGEAHTSSTATCSEP
ncbi:hypothetical protein O1611_g9177 [Lasiodiplodia mahajangana]|uniref:Uncharacterized protein n=1 Tax=Lasiodiplodia mahajangana TaxID=1108764 RepID=A0ACC2JAT2_9PEZI|nr:hypothetical protein O1611_g9177 [Lasiodiplodia mahajangana]